VTTLRELVKNLRKTTDKTKDNILDFKLENLKLFKYLLNFFFAGIVAGVGMVFPIMFFQGFNVGAILFFISIAGLVFFGGIIRYLIIHAEGENRKGSRVVFIIGFLIGFVLLIGGTLDI
jgi:uncharacterized membrane protein HdeD (DUF308 family)|tara:strand:- start:136 stop:492 length:357 start_codon:yes stop_codon:yes gene_type:complete